MVNRNMMQLVDNDELGMVIGEYMQDARRFQRVGYLYLQSRDVWYHKRFWRNGADEYGCASPPISLSMQRMKYD